MFDGLKLWALKRKLRGSLSEDPLQLNWEAWLKAAPSIRELYASCSSPGWLVHCAYWDGQKQDKMVEAALEMAQLAIEHGPPNVFSGTTVMDVRQKAFPDIAELITKLEKKFPAIIGFERAYPGMSSVQLGQLDAARAAAHGDAKHDDAKLDLATAGKAGAAAAGFSLALQTLFHRHYGMIEPLMLSTAGAAAMFSVAMPDHKLELMAVLRDRFGWAIPAA